MAEGNNQGFKTSIMPEKKWVKKKKIFDRFYIPIKPGSPDFSNIQNEKHEKSGKFQFDPQND